MRMMTLDDVVRAGQEGAEWKQQQEAQAKQRKEQEDLEAANQAASSILARSQQEWAASGSPGQYRPSDTTMLQAAEARGMELARRGRWDQFLRNDATLMGHRIRVRTGALQQFEQDGDVDRLARTIYPTVFDGKQIVGSEIVPGGDGAQKGAPSGPTMYRFKLSDGSTTMVDPHKMVAHLRQSLVDPQKAAEMEMQLNFLRAKTDVETGGKVKVEQAKGAEERTTEGVKQANRLTLADAETQGRLQVTSAEGANRARVAGIEAASRKEVAKLNAERGEGGGDGRGLQAAQRWQEMAAKHFGQFSGGMMGGTRLAGQATLDLAAVAQRIHEANKGVLTESQALDQAARFLKLNSPQPGLGSLIDKQQ